MNKKKEERVMDLTPLMDVVRTLRGPGGCPWDQAQDHKSMRRELVEEVYELLEAIDDGDVKGIREELGDVLFQVVFHARLAEEVGAFTMQDVITDVSRKLIHRHPHVYGTVTVGSAEELLKNWDALKAEEKKERKSALDGIARDLPSLMRAYKLSERSSRKGFDWPDADRAYEKVKEEEAELAEAILSQNKDHMEEELGDLFFALSVYARKLGLEPETALHRANVKYEKRFRKMEEVISERNKKWENLSIFDMILLWKSVKREKI